jgi:hypothetical protein
MALVARAQLNPSHPICCCSQLAMHWCPAITQCQLSKFAHPVAGGPASPPPPPVPDIPSPPPSSSPPHACSAALATATMATNARLNNALLRRSVPRTSRCSVVVAVVAVIAVALAPIMLFSWLVPRKLLGLVLGPDGAEAIVNECLLEARPPGDGWHSSLQVARPPRRCVRPVFCVRHVQGETGGIYLLCEARPRRTWVRPVFSWRRVHRETGATHLPRGRAGSPGRVHGVSTAPAGGAGMAPGFLAGALLRDRARSSTSST